MNVGEFCVAVVDGKVMKCVVVGRESNGGDSTILLVVPLNQTKYDHQLRYVALDKVELMSLSSDDLKAKLGVECDKFKTAEPK